MKSEGGWRPSIIAMTRFGERRLGHFDLLRWISHRHGFGHFIQFFQGEYSFTKEIEARMQVGRLIERTEVSGAGIFVDSLISPSFQTALAQTLQMHRHFGLAQQLRSARIRQRASRRDQRDRTGCISLPRNRCLMS